MDALISELTKKPFKNWKNLFQPFLTESVLKHAQQHDDGLSCFLMGLFHEQGLMVDRSCDLALQYFRQGANKRDPLCLYKLYEIHSGKNFYGVEPDKEVGLLYLIWAVTYMFPVYGSYMCLDLDLELQSYYKITLKQDKEQIFDIIDDYEDDIFGCDKELIKCVFGFLIEFISPTSGFNAQEQYENMIDTLIKLAEKGDSRFPALFLFKCVLWDFKGVSNKDHKRVMNLIRQKRSISFIFEQLKSVFDYISLLDKKHTIFSRLIHFHSVEIFLQIKYNCDYEDIPNKEEALDYIANFLYKSIGLMDNNHTKSMAIYLRAKSCMSRSRQDPERDLSQAINVIESSRQLSGFAEQDFPFILGGRLYSKAGNNAMSASYFEKYINYSSSSTNLPVKFYEQGQYFEHCKQNGEKAIESYVKGLHPSSDTNSFLQECYAAKCKAKILKLINADDQLYSKFYCTLEKERLFNDDE